MSSLLGSTEFRVFSQGVVRKSEVDAFLAPKNSVQHALNVHFDKIGAVRVRSGTTLLGTAPGSGNCLGLHVFTTDTSATNYPVAVFGTTSYFYNGTVWTSIDGGFAASTKVRFENFANYIFSVNGSNSMRTWSGSGAWGSTQASGAPTTTLIREFKQRMYSAGDTTYPDRLYYSTIIDSSLNINWTGSTSGSIDIDPDYGGNITALQKVSNMFLIFKEFGMYRFNGKTVDTDLVVDVGTLTQEATTVHRGWVYFVNPDGFWRTNSAYPEYLSRPIQDWIDAVPLSGWQNAALKSDNKSIECNIGDVTLGGRTYTNAAFRYTPQDGVFTVYSRADRFRVFARYDTTSGRTILGGDSNGGVQTMDSGTTDNGTNIQYELVTQEQDFGVRQDIKSISDDITIFATNGQGGKFAVQTDGKGFDEIANIDMRYPVHIARSVKKKGHVFEFKWYGISSQTSPEFNGFHIANITDEGMKGK